MAITTTNWSGMTTFNDMLTGANANGPFWTGILFMLFAIFVITTSSITGFVGGLLVGSFLAFILGLFLAYMGLVAWYWVLMIFGFMIVGILWTMFTKR